MKDRINQVLKKIHPGIDFTVEDRIFTGHVLDSLEFTEVVSALEDEFGVTIDFEKLMPANFDSLEKIEKLLSE